MELLKACLSFSQPVFLSLASCLSFPTPACLLSDSANRLAPPPVSLSLSVCLSLSLVLTAAAAAAAADAAAAAADDDDADPDEALMLCRVCVDMKCVCVVCERVSQISRLILPLSSPT